MSDESSSRIAVDQVVKLALQMAEASRDFYESLGGAARDPRIFQLCHRLAQEEDKHRETFRQLHRELALRNESVLLTEKQILATQRHIQEHAVPMADTVREVTCGGSALDALTLAVKMEAESVRFYTQIAEQLPPGNAIESIIAEERAHLRLLSAVRCGVATN